MSQNYDFLRSFTFNGKETKHLFQIAKLNIPFLSKENEFFQVGNTDGKKFRNTRLGDYSISIDGFIIKDNTGVDVSTALDQLKLIINSDEPKKLIFDIFPDRYFNAIFSGVQEYDATDLRYTPLTLVFDVPDGLAHQIEPNTYTNVYSTSRNLVLDSEYHKKDVYLHQGVKLAEEKYNGSSIVYVDYREGIPYGGSAQDEYVWLPIQSMNRRNLPELKVGQDVNFSIEAKVLAIDEDDERPEAGNLVLEEWSVNPSKVLRTHFINIPKEVGDFKKYGKVIKITDPNTKALNLNYGITGLDTIIHWSKPMMSLLPPLGATVNAPSNNSNEYNLDYDPSYYQTINYEASTTGISDLIKVKNNGTYKTTPRFIFTTQGENGLVALAKDDGSILQFGNPEEVDNVTNVVSQQVVSWSFYGSQLPTNMEVNVPIGSSYPYMSNNHNTPNIIQGSWNMDLDVDSALPVWKPGETKEVWHGPTLRHAIPLDSVGNRNGEFSTHNRFRFYTPNQKHRGRIEYVISDDNVENYLGFVLRDSATTNTNMVMECWYKGKLLKSITISRKDFTKDFFEINMYRYKKSLHWRLVQVKGITNRNTVIIDKQVEFNYNLDEEDTTPIKYWGVWTERYQNSNYIRPFVTDTQFRWISTHVVQNIRNYFQEGDIIEIDVKSRQILVNGVVNNELNVVGNQWEKFVLDIGETTIQPIVSSWANPAEVICIVEESYL
jgi:predicted phage tail component-like protein|nr:MAG TPA: distal tail protein [Caudoviricetes sp.]